MFAQNFFTRDLLRRKKILPLGKISAARKNFSRTEKFSRSEKISAVQSAQTKKSPAES
ncbi:MAG: hypothetical protein IJG80_04095 [Selenomonadaceae bacterium]|nr:hypothetical protein [Selenomonadaceae bacterium]MBQ3726134.1 hypothetical protein [Selenomonadaceae bacterium]MBQ9496714.1 hypothetical protein [Selenomonadaceae bacterium]